MWVSEGFDAERAFNYRNRRLRNLGTNRIYWLVVMAVGGGIGLYATIFGSLDTDMAFLSLATILGLFGIMLMGEIRKPLLIVLLLDIPIPIDQFFNLRHNAIKGGTQGYIVSLTTLCLLVLYALWLAELLGAPKGPARTQGTINPWKYTISLLMFISISALSMLAAPDLEMAYFEMFLLIQMFLMFLYIVGTTKTPDDLFFILKWLLVGSALHAGIMLGLFVHGTDVDIGNVITARVDYGRVGGTIGGPNSAAGYLELLIPIALGLLLMPIQPHLRMLAISNVCLCSVGLLMTQSRGGWVAFAVSISLFVLIATYRGWIPLSVIFFLVLVGLGIGGGFHSLIAERLFGDDNGSSSARLPLIQVSFNMIQAKPLLGIGLNNYPTELLKYARLDRMFLWKHVVHNKFLLVWSEIGIFGLLAFSAFLLNALRRAWQVWQTQLPTMAPLGLSMAVALVGHMFHMNVDIFQGRALVQTLWLLCALITVLYRFAIQSATELIQPVTQGGL